MTDNDALLRPGRFQAVAAVVLAAATAAVIAAPTSARADFGGRLAMVGVVAFVIALAVGSARAVGLATVPVLGSALIATSGADDPDWVRSIVVGCLWYVAVELAWDSIERRDGGERTSALVHRRVHEVATVVTLSLIVTISGFLASGVAPPRTLLTQGPIVVGLLAAIGLTSRHLVKTSY